MIYCCGNHIDQAIDDFVDEYQEPPDISVCAELSSETHLCVYCTNSASYILQRVKMVEGSQGSGWD